MSPKKQVRKLGKPIIPQSPQFKAGDTVFAVLAGPVAVVTARKKSGKQRKG